jgi:hypothetical protein
MGEKMMITREEILRGVEIPEAMEGNLKVLLERLNKFRAWYGKPMIVTSGYRDPGRNAEVGGSTQSSHMTCQAADFRDTDGLIAARVLANREKLVEFDLYMEDPEFTKGWCHLQWRPTRSGNRVFKP